MMVQLVGILNVTPDSFSDGGQFLDPEKAIAQADKLFADGAQLVDVGAESTRPNATPLTSDEEWQRLEPVLSVLIPKYPGRIMLDSYHTETIEHAFAIGPVIINDVTGLHSPDMVEAVLKHNAMCVVNHIYTVDVQAAHARPTTDSVNEVVDYLLKKEQMLVSRGLAPDHIILDPGIGFGKTPEVNWQLLEIARHMPGKQVMIGYSRKRFLGEQRMELEPNLKAAHTAATSGAHYLRVHDVKEHAEFLTKFR